MGAVENKERYVGLLTSVKREGIDALIDYLNNSDFFTAPASCHYHQNYEGGLCEHSLQVYDKLVKIVNDFGDKEYSNDTLILVALCHDLAKTNFYEQYDKNVKVDGQWVQEKCYRVKNAKDRFIFTNHEHTSLFIAQQFVPLSIEEQVAIACHHGGQGDKNTHIDVVAEAYSRYKLPLYLHVADLLDAYE